MNATAGKIDADAEIRCWVMPEDTTLERLLVVAAAANTIRSAMNPIEEMEAYSAMAQAGIKVRAIAETFGIDKKVVEQRHALGRSDERRGGKACVSKCKCRWSAYH